MSGDAESDLKTLRELLGIGAQADAEPTPFARNVTDVLTRAIAALRENGVIEVEDAKLECLTREIVDVALESTSTRKLPLRIVKALIHSEQVEEVYGTDEEIGGALRPFLEEL